MQIELYQKNVIWLNRKDGNRIWKLLHCLFSISSYFRRWNACKFTWTNYGVEFSVLFLVEVKSRKLNARKFERRYQQWVPATGIGFGKWARRDELPGGSQSPVNSWSGKLNFIETPGKRWRDIEYAWHKRVSQPPFSLKFQGN